MEMTRAVAEKVKKIPDKNKGKRPRPQESDDELEKNNEQHETEEESGKEKSEAGDMSGEISSDTEIRALQNEAEVEDQNKMLDTLNKQKEQLRVRIKAAKKTNQAKLTKLRKTLDAYPSVRSVLLYHSISRTLITYLSRSRQNCHQEGKRRKRLMSKWVPLPLSVKSRQLL